MLPLQNIVIGWGWGGVNAAHNITITALSSFVTGVHNYTTHTHVKIVDRHAPANVQNVGR